MCNSLLSKYCCIIVFEFQKFVFITKACPTKTSLIILAKKFWNISGLIIIAEMSNGCCIVGLLDNYC